MLLLQAKAFNLNFNTKSLIEWNIFFRKESYENILIVIPGKVIAGRPNALSCNINI